MSTVPARIEPVAPLAPQAQDLRCFNTLGLASHAPAFVALTEPSQLPALSALAPRFRQLVVLGGGSNVVLPASIDGLVAQVRLPGVRLVGQCADAWVVEAAAGENWHGFVTACVDNGWDGLENLALIPGTVGAAPVQNIGAYGVELADRFHSLTAWDVKGGRWVEMGAAECRFAYRDSFFKHQEPGAWVIGSVRFALPRPGSRCWTIPTCSGMPRWTAPRRPPAPCMTRCVRSGAPSCPIPPWWQCRQLFQESLWWTRARGRRCLAVSPAWFRIRSPMAATSWPPAG